MSGSLKPFRPIHDAGTPWLVLADDEFESIAEDLVRRAPPGTIEMMKISWQLFPDGTPNIYFDARVVEGRDVLLFVSLAKTEALLSTISVIFAVPRSLSRTFTCICPFYPTGTMERVEREGEVATAMTMARVLSATPSPQLGQSAFIFFDIHALVTRFYFSDNVKIHLASAIPIFLKKLQEVEHEEGRRPVLAFPDEGARKRFGRPFKGHYELILCIKTRVGDRRKLVIQEGEPKGQHVFIVDDLVQSGGTLIACRDALYARGATKVSAYVTHGVFPNDAWKKFLPENTPAGVKPFHRFLLTDTIPHTAKAVSGRNPFEILTIADRLLEMLSEPLISECPNKTGISKL